VREHRVKIDDIKFLVIEWKSKIDIYCPSMWVITGILHVNMDKLKTWMSSGYMALAPSNGSFADINSSITYLHNSNRQLRQTTLSGEIIQEEKFHVIGFVPADVVRLNKAVWFKKLDSNQVSSVDKFLTTPSY